MEKLPYLSSFFHLDQTRSEKPFWITNGNKLLQKNLQANSVGRIDCWITFARLQRAMKIEFHLAIFAIVLKNVHSAPNRLARRQGSGYESIVVFAVPSSPVVNEPVAVPYEPLNVPVDPPNVPYNPPSVPYDPPRDTPTYCRHGFRSTSQHTDNHRYREQTVQTRNYHQVVGETLETRNYSPYSSYDREETAKHQTPYHPVRDSFESSSYRRNDYERENSQVNQV